MFEDMSVRAQNAYEGLVEILFPHAGEYAEAVAEYYINEKIVKLDVNIGRYKVLHGAFYEADIIDAAVELVK